MVSGVTSHTFVADGPIAGETYGEGAPVLMLHGGPGMTDYMSVLDGETDGWRRIRYQQRGLAPSAQDGPFTVEAHVADALAVLDELGVDQAVVLGHSWGGHLALHLALAAPERVTGLICVDPLGGVGDGGVTEMGQRLTGRLLPQNAAAHAKVGERLEGPDASGDDMIESLRLVWPGYFADQASVLPFSPQWQGSLACYAGTFGSVVEHMAGGFTEALAGITAPTVFVLGELSPMPVSQGEQTAAKIPGAQVMVVPGAGHFPWFERPGCVTEALAALR
jgi:pimeloyl-ACP methyl ester carboxylesterase